ncbi:hypothetical protein HPP92_026646 [Vanilla planifolia]|uniref:NPH3 domain-containing protein n=1 Tax=Vanilla planifolia TaxID=51239 RepID=A0A835U773_VANPL|nr:hypothetical protein HPP92_026646 [Vanilla planifolia]
MYDVDLILNIIDEFLRLEQSNSKCNPQTSGELQELRNRMVAVSKLIDGCLIEAAKDPNLPLLKFVELAEIVSSSSRPVHDGLYCAIDMFLKEHPELTKSEKKNICRLMDCKKLSSDACMHVVQNDRLPLRVVVQVLFFEQVRRSTIAVCRSDLSSGVAQDNGGISHGSSSAATMSNSGNEWDLLPTVGDVSSLRTTKLWKTEESSNFKVKHSVS